MIAQIDTLFRALGDHNRLRMVLLMVKGPLNVSEIVEILGLSQSNVSHHLRTLLNAGILKRSGRGNWAFYSIRSDEPLVETVVNGAFENRHLVAGFSDDMSRLARCLAGRKKKVREFFNSIGEEELNSLLKTLPDKGAYLPFISHSLGDTEPVVEVGCGSGGMIPFLLRNAGEVIAVDSSRIMLDLAEKNTQTTRDGSRVMMRLGEAEHLPVENSAAGGVLMHMVLHHCGSPEQAIQEAHRVLRPGGVLVVVDLLEHQDQVFRNTQGDLWPGFDIQSVEEMITGVGFRIKQTGTYSDKRILAVAGVKGDTEWITK